MKLIHKLDKFKVYPTGRRTIGEFLCRFCKSTIERELTSGLKSHSCGCVKSQGKLNGRYSHGFSKHPLYSIWVGMVDGCERETHKDYNRYGGRGIKVCPAWRADRASFIRWGIKNGWASGLKIDRENNDGDYSPENCRFSTNEINCQNRSSNRINFETATKIKQMLKTMGCCEVSSVLGISKHIIHDISCGRCWRNA